MKKNKGHFNTALFVYYLYGFSLNQTEGDWNVPNLRQRWGFACFLSNLRRIRHALLTSANVD